MRHALGAVVLAALFSATVSAAAPPPQAAWSTLVPSDDNLAPYRAGAVAIRDPQRDRLIVMGSGRLQTFELWTMSLGRSPVWRQRHLFGGPGSVDAAILDPLRDRIIVFGTWVGGLPTSDVWQLSLAEPMTWTPLAPLGPRPSPRPGSSAIFDPVRDRMVVFGGSETGLNETWALSLAGTPTWEQLAPTGELPEQRFGHSAIYDPVGDRMLVLGGHHYDPTPGASPVPEGVWALSLAGTPHWDLLPVADPRPFTGHSAGYDPARHRMLVFGGGYNLSVVDWMHELWSLDLASLTWSRVAAASPAGLGDRALSSVVVDPTRDRLVIYGGQNELGNPLNEVWDVALDTQTWQLSTPDALTDSPVTAHAGWYSYYQQVLLDERNHKLVLMGGQRSEGAPVAMWQLPLDGQPAWSALPLGTSPYPTLYLPAVHDPATDRIVSPTGHYFRSGFFNQLLVFTRTDVATSSIISLPGESPVYRHVTQLLRDDSRHRLVLYGGRRYDSISPVYYDYHDLWSVPLDGSGPWTQLGTEAEGAALPPGRVILDAPRDRLLLFPKAGGAVWSHALGSSGPWTELAWEPEAIGERLLVLDAPFSRLLAIDPLGRVEGLALFATDEWQPLDVAGLPPQRIPAQASFDATTGRVLLHDASMFDNGVYVLELLSLPSEMLHCAQAEVRPGRIWLLWVGPAATERASVYRREPGDVWHKIGEIQRSSKSGVLGYVDHDARPGSTTEYRLGLQTSGAERAAGAITIDVPDVVSLALSGAVANPSTDGLTVTFSLPDGSPATLEVLDLSGRRVVSRAVGELGVGRHQVRLAGRGLEPGMYFLRLSRGGERLHARAVVIR